MTHITDAHLEALNEVLSIQKAAIIIASNKLNSPLQIHKTPVSKFTLDYLSAYFAVKINPPCTTHGTEAYIKITSQHCDIIVNLKAENNG